MTIQGAIAELQNLLNANDVPFCYKGGIQKVIETISMEFVEQNARLGALERKIYLHEKAMAKVMADRKTEPSFKVDEIGDDDPTIHAIAYLQKVGWLQEHDQALTEPNSSEKPNNCEDEPQTEEWYTYQDEQEYNARHGKE